MMEILGISQSLYSRYGVMLYSAHLQIARRSQLRKQSRAIRGTKQHNIVFMLPS